MKIHFIPTTAFLASILVIWTATTQVSQGCAACGCTLSSDWASQGYSVEPGLKLDVNYTYIDQSQLRNGTGKISASDVPLESELEKYSRTSAVTLGLDYIINADWAVTLQVPYLVRDHATLGEDHVSLDTSSTASIGDIKLVGRYQGFTSKHNLGVELGIKLPTGSYTDNFKSGEALDRGLQPGTGTTDLIAGLYYFDNFATDWGYFARATVQTAFNSRNDYKPGTNENVSLGLRYTGFSWIIPQLQLNSRFANRDSGEEADAANSGGTLLYISPGVTVEVTKQLSAYVFVQVPLYQNVKGNQLSPTWTLSTGLRAAF